MVVRLEVYGFLWLRQGLQVQHDHRLLVALESRGKATAPCLAIIKEVDQMNGLKLLFHLQPGNSATGPLPETTHNASDRNKASALLSSPKRPSLPSDGAI